MLDIIQELEYIIGDSNHVFRIHQRPDMEISSGMNNKTLDSADMDGIFWRFL